MHFGMRDRCAKEIIRVDVEADLFAYGSEFLWTFHRDFKFRLLVFLNVEIATRLRFTDGSGNVVAAERSFVAEIDLATKGAAIRQRQVLFKQLSVTRVFDHHVNGLAVEQFVAAAGPLTQDAFKEDGLGWSVNRPVGVDVAGQFVARQDVVFTAITTEVKA